MAHDLPDMNDVDAVRAWIGTGHSDLMANIIRCYFDLRIQMGDSPAEAAECVLRAAVGEKAGT